MAGLEAALCRHARYVTLPAYETTGQMACPSALNSHCGSADIRALREMGVGCIDFGFGGSTADEVLATMQKFRTDVLPLV
jgi:hypothetical protein